MSTQAREVTNTVFAGEAFLGAVIGEFSQGLGGGKANTDRNADPLPDGVADFLAVIDEVKALETVKAEKAFVN